MANCLKEINAVAAIHIGSSYSTYGFSFIHHWEQTFKKIWNWNGGISWWTKSCLLLKKDFTKSLIGEEAEDKYSELTEDGCQRDYFFFQRLHHNLAVHQYTCCKDIEGQTLEADFVFAHYIKYLKELVQENIEKGFPFNQIPKGEIGYVLIVPDAWRHDSKNFMRDAAVKAGIEKEHFNIVFEREAVAVYCHCIELIEDGHAKTPAPSLDHVKPGTKFMVVDLGYGTTVITVHQKCEDNTLEEVLPASEGPWGGKAVDDQFMKLLSELVGEEVWENFKRENEKEHLDIIKSLQLKRKEITQKQGKTRIAIPWKLVELCIESYGVDTFNEVIEKNDALKNNVAFVGGKLECDNDIFRNFFRKSVGAIIKTIDEIFQESKARDIETIYMVGEFSNCVLVQDALRNFFVKKTIIVPIEPELAVLKGAVYWGNFLTPFPRRSAMYKHFQKKAKCRKMKRPKEMADRVLKIGFIGAGAINFGRLHVPWDHASRLEQIGGIEVVGIVELDEKLATEILQTRQSSAKYGRIYKNCKIFKNYKDLITLLPDAVFIGIPPAYRGSFDEGKDLELQFVRAGIHVFVEKPLSVLPPEEFMPYAKAVTETCKKKNVIVSVGYMFRYHAGILKMKELIKQHGGKVMALNARYYFAYTKAINKYWFNEDFSGGPIVEQATHFCDLARFIVSDVEIDTIHTLLLKDSDPSGAGHLDYVPQEAEDDITPAKRIPRVTMSHWRFKDGGLGTLMHSVALPGTRYEANIDVQLDGLKLSLIEPYEKDCILRVRSINNEDANKDQDFTFPSDDSYLSELGTFIKAIRTNDPSLVKSPYSDAALTYQMTWAIRRAS